jgi:hypothetical protein
MFVAGGLMWLNIGPEENVIVEYDRTYIHPQPAHEWKPIYANVRFLGWPITFKGVEKWGSHFSSFYLVTDPSIKLSRLAIDVFIALLVLLTAAFFCEWRIRRREAHKP